MHFWLSDDIFFQSPNQLFRKLVQEYVQSVKTFVPNKAWRYVGLIWV